MKVTEAQRKAVRACVVGAGAKHSVERTLDDLWKAHLDLWGARAARAPQREAQSATEIGLVRAKLIAQTLLPLLLITQWEDQWDREFAAFYRKGPLP